MRPGILGGTFNPIHNGHIQIATKALKEYSLDRVLVMPSGISYLKAGTGVLDSAIRSEMVRLAIWGMNGLFIDDRETKRAGNSYTCETVTELRRENPDDEFFYIIGADTLKSIVKWKNPEMIFAECTLLVAVRDNVQLEELQEIGSRYLDKYNAKVSFLHCGRIDISSTAIRRMVAEGKEINDLVPPAVCKFIKDNGYYR